MRLGITHLSDIHIKTRKDLDILDKKKDELARNIGRALRGCNGNLIIVTGDVTWSGLKEEYELAEKFLSALSEKVGQILKCAPPALLMVPGNHDCDHSRGEKIRAALVESPELHEADENFVAKCTEIQEEFFLHANRNLNKAKLPNWESKNLRCRLELEISETIVVLDLWNTAWSSKLIEEAGTLVIPEEAIKSMEKKGKVPTICVLHHTLHWFTQSCARQLRKAMLEHYDIILMGHEHETESLLVGQSPRAQSQWYDGGILLNPENPNTCEFRTLVIDTEEETTEEELHVWDIEKQFFTSDAKKEGGVKRDLASRRDAALLSDFMKDYLEDPGVAFSHQKKQQISLSDIFVFPALREFRVNDKNADEMGKDLGSEEDTVSYILEQEHTLILGAEQSGKTCLAKRLFTKLLQNGNLPLLVSGEHFVTASKKRTERYIIEHIEIEYEFPDVDRFQQLIPEKGVLIIDCYEEINLKLIDKEALLSHLLTVFSKVIILGGDSVRVEEIRDLGKEHNTLWSFSHVELLPMNLSTQHEIVKKWYEIGGFEGRTSEEINNALWKLETQIARILKAEMVPLYPLFLLTMLQRLDFGDKINSAQSGSFGFLYEALITASMLKFSGGVQLDAQHNYLAELAYRMFKDGLVEMDADCAKKWHDVYCDEYRLDREFDKFTKTLCSAGLLSRNDGVLGFRYPYIYCYFVARYMRDNLRDSTIQTQIQELTERLQHGASAAIIMFLCHLTKDPFVVDIVLERAKNLFGEAQPCDLDQELAFLKIDEEDVKSVLEPIANTEDTPTEVIKEISAEDRRQIVLRSRDEAKRKLAAAKAQGEGEIQQAVDLSICFKTVQLLGQILRNFYGSLKGNRKEEILEIGIALSLRQLTVIYGLIEEEKIDILAGVKRKLAVEMPDIAPETLRAKGAMWVFGLTQFLTVAVMRQLSDSVGCQELQGVFKPVFERNEGMSYRMIDLCIKMDYLPGTPVNRIEELKQHSANNFFLSSLLQRLVWLHLYSFDVPHRVQQRLLALFDAQKSQKKLMVSKAKRKQNHSRGKKKRK